MSLTRRTWLMLGGGGVVLAAAVIAALVLPRLLAPAPVEVDPTPVNLTAALAQPAPDGDMTIGSDKAPVTIIEYASMTCPHCAHFSETTFPELKKRYIDTGKVRFTFREFPLDKLAAAGSMLARCASKDGGSERYMAVVETLFAKQQEWVVPDNPVPPLKNIAKQFGFTEDSFNACLQNQSLMNSIEATRDRAAAKLGVNSTPTIFVNGKKVSGDVSIEALAKEIDPYLKAE